MLPETTYALIGTPRGLIGTPLARTVGFFGFYVFCIFAVLGRYSYGLPAVRKGLKPSGPDHPK